MRYSKRQIAAHPRGFTLTELVVIIMIIGVLAVTATARFGSSDAFLARGYSDELAAAARYAQRYAVASNCRVRFALSGAGYTVRMESAPCNSGVASYTVDLQDPTGTTFAGSTPSGVTLTAGANNYDYDAYGDLVAPGGGGTVTTSGGGSSASFVIEAGSGYVNQ